MRKSGTRRSPLFLSLSLHCSALFLESAAAAVFRRRRRRRLWACSLGLTDGGTAIPSGAPPKCCHEPQERPKGKTMGREREELEWNRSWGTQRRALESCQPRWKERPTLRGRRPIPPCAAIEHPAPYNSCSGATCSPTELRTDCEQKRRDDRASERARSRLLPAR